MKSQKLKHLLIMGFNKTLVILVFFLTVHSCYSQTNRYMVFFSDKNGISYTITNPSEFLSAKAIARRTKQGININDFDLPVNTNYCQALQDAGASVYYKTKWFNGVLVQCKAAVVPALKSLSFVSSVILVAPDSLLSKGARLEDLNVITKPDDALMTDTQLQMIGIDHMHVAGYHGEGITIAIIDAGFPGVDTQLPFKSLIDEGRIDLAVSHNFVLNSKNVFSGNSHGTKVLSIIAADNNATFTGGANKSNFQLYITEYDPTEYRIEEYNWLFAAERADSAGADVISSSLGYNTFDDPAMNYTQENMDGKTAVISRAAQFAVDRGLLVVCSAGNEGSSSWHTITAPADVKDVIAVGNINAIGQLSSSSSVGPTADGRIKPDVVALGTDVSLIDASGSITSGSGTSFAAPLVASLAAGLWQEYPMLTSLALVKVIRSTASQHADPDNFLGYGIPNYEAVNNYFSFTEQPKDFEVFPNPFNNILKIQSKNPDEIGSCQYELINSQGQVFETRTVEFNWLNPVYSIRLDLLSSGIYFMRIHGSKKNYFFKLVKS